MAKIFVVGSINQDVVISLDRRPNPGETVFGSALKYFPGGKGSNQAIAAHLLGGDVAFLGKLGGDAFAVELREYMARFGLQGNLLTSPGQATGTAVILVDPTGENSIVVVPGANGELAPEDCGSLREMGRGDFLVLQNEIPLGTMQHAVEMASSQGARTVFNAAPAVQLDEEVLRKLDLVIVNEHEFETLFQRPLGNGELVDWEKVLAETSQQFEVGILLTLGHRGVVGVLNGNLEFAEGVPVHAVDTTGAGDCFVGAVVASLSRGVELPKALAFANMAAADSVTREGASSSFPDKERIDSILAQQGGVQVEDG